MHELPLVFFTVFAQCAVGLMLIAFVSQKLSLASDKQLNLANVLAFVLMGAGFVIGMFHLGQLFRAPNMLAGIGRSPMSNEIVLSGAFMLFLVATLFFTFMKKNSKLSALCNMLAIVIGLAFMWSITKVYQLNTVPAWNTGYTSLQMWMTVFIGGGACALLLGMRTLGAISLLAGAAVILFSRAGYMDFIDHISPHMTAAQSLFWTIQLFCLAVGILAAGTSMFKKDGMGAIVAICSIAVVIGEVASRIAFYNLWAISM